MPGKPKSTRKQKARSSARKGKAKQVRVLESKVPFKGHVFTVTSERVLEPNGVTAVRDVIRHSGSVVILPVDDSQGEPRVLLERQYRYAAGDYMLEIPAGRVDPGEKELAAAKRELLEETGYRARKWQKILFFYPSPGFLAETMSVYMASGLQAGEAQPEADEKIECQLVPLSQALRMLDTGKIRDGKTITSLLWLERRLSDPKL